jgi:RND family efflux transporter MFP subunit
MSRKLTLGALAVLAVLAACRQKSEGNGLAAGSAFRAEDVPGLSALGSASATAVAAAGTEDGALVGTGTLKAVAEAELGPKVTGVITGIYVKEGDIVKKGQTLFRLDASQAALAAQQASVGVQAAEVARGAAELDFQRTKELFDRGSVAPATFDQVKARYDASKAGVDQAKAALSMAHKAGADTAVTSPIAGVVTAKLKNVGELATMMPPTVVLIVQDVSKLELRVRLPDRVLRSLRAGSTMQVKFPAMGVGRSVVVDRINPAIDARTRTIEVVSLIDNATGELKPGMLAEVKIGDGTEPASLPAGAASTREN